MPELPEVETVCRLIRPRIVGRRVLAADVHWKRTIGASSVPAFRKAVVGTRIVRVWRRAKYIVIDLERDDRPAGAIVGHLRMTGRLVVEPPRPDVPPYGRVALELDDGNVLHFIDVRKFGRFGFAADPDEVFSELGPEPLSDEFTEELFVRELRSRRRVLKPLLLDQSFVAGLGNIYVDESLFRSGLHPLRRADRVSRAAAGRLWKEIRDTLAEAIEREGSSFDTFYRTPEGKPGSYQDQFRVYGRDGRPCRSCGRPIKKLVVGQRGRAARNSKMDPSWD